MKDTYQIRVTEYSDVQSRISFAKVDIFPLNYQYWLTLWCLRAAPVKHELPTQTQSHCHSQHAPGTKEKKNNVNFEGKATYCAAQMFLFFIPLKLELLTQFPASNDENYVYLKGLRGMTLIWYFILHEAVYTSQFHGTRVFW